MVKLIACFSDHGEAYLNVRCNASWMSSGHSPHVVDRFVGRPHGMRKESVVDDRCLVAVAPLGMPRSCRCVLDHGHLKATLEKFAQMGFYAHVRQHAAQNDPSDSTLAQLQDKIVGLRPEHFVRADDDGLPVFYVRLEALQ